MLLTITVLLLRPWQQGAEIVDVIMPVAHGNYAFFDKRIT